MAKRKEAGVPLVASEKERARQKENTREKQKHIFEAAVEEARHNIVQKNFDRAVEIGLTAMRDAMMIFGEDAIELMPGYFVISDGYLELKQPKRAEEFLIQANWNLMKHQPSAQDSNTGASYVSETDLGTYHSRLHKNFGKLFSKINRHADAIKELSQNIYIESKSKGPENYSITESYQHLGDTFLAMHKPEEAAGFFHLIFKIWKKILENGQDEEIPSLEMEEACEMLKKIYETLVDMEGAEACSEIN